MTLKNMEAELRHKGITQRQVAESMGMTDETNTTSQKQEPTYTKGDVFLIVGWLVLTALSLAAVCYLVFSVPALDDPAWAEPLIRASAASCGALSLWGGLMTCAKLT